MKKFALGAMASAFLVLSTTGPASANYTFDVMATFLLGGTLTGTLTTNSTNTAVVSYDLIASSGPGAPGSGLTYPGFEYTPSNSFIYTMNLPSSLQIEATGTFSPGPPFLNLGFADAGLTTSGGTFAGGSDEYEPNLGGRFLLGSIVPATVPEPSSLVLCGIAGVAGLAVAGVRRSRAPARSNGCS
jgi:hypothetical protein